jgi:hypothetical protein
MTNLHQEIDLSFRPAAYFWPLDLKTHVLSSIKGADRKAVVEKFFENGRESEIPPELLQSSLSDELRRATGAIHPSLMGGEYLPDQAEDEVEIARIAIASTTHDVTSVYASRGSKNILFRVVDEYGGDTLSGPAEKESSTPLTLSELYDFFLGAWDLFSVLEMNFDSDGYPEDEVINFFSASSEFYPAFDQLVGQRVKEWLREKDLERNG